MSYLNALKNGDIPKKKRKKIPLTPYDEFIRNKELKTPVGRDAVSVIKPISFNDIEKLIDELKAKQGVIIDLSSVSPVDAQRMLDFLSGAVYALEGKIERINLKMFVMTPKGVDILSSFNT